LGYADLVLTNGSVYTVKVGTDWNSSPYEAIAIKGDKILSTGTTDDMNQFTGPETKVYDLKGKMVLPGFIDTHIHFGLAAQLRAGANLSSCQTVSDYQNTLKEYANSHQDEEVIRGFGWSYVPFTDKGPLKETIDEVIPDKPVILVSFDTHSCWVNSKALEIAGIDASSPNPDTGKIERDDQGNPTGTLREPGAMNLVNNKVPPISPDKIQEMLEETLQKASALGVTTADDALVIPDIIEAYSNLENEDHLPVRIFGEIIAIPELGEDEIPVMKIAGVGNIIDHLSRSEGWYTNILPDAMKENITTDESVNIENVSDYLDNLGLFRLRTAKLFVDGVIESHTGYLLEPYTDQPDNYGMTNWNKTDYDNMISALDKDGFQIDVHAIGDGAVRMALDGYENAGNTNGVRDSRHKISHIQLINKTDIPRLSELGVIAALQPNWFYYDQNYNTISLPSLGEDRASHMYSLRSLIDSGDRVAFGTDWPAGTDYLTINPLDGIKTAVTRLPLPPDSNITIPYGPEERIDLKTAIEDYTYSGAYTNFMENLTGSLETGKLADIIVIDKNLFNLTPEDINKAHVVATYLEGKKVFGTL